MDFGAAPFVWNDSMPAAPVVDVDWEWVVTYTRDEYNNAFNNYILAYFKQVFKRRIVQREIYYVWICKYDLDLE